MRTGSETIWGEADSVSPLPGIPAWHVETPGHGGYAVDARWAMENLSPSAVAIAGYEEFGCLWFEEDCDWCIPILDNEEFAAAAAKEWVRASSVKSEATPERLMELARSTAGRWHTGYLQEKGLS